MKEKRRPLGAFFFSTEQPGKRDADGPSGLRTILMRLRFEERNVVVPAGNIIDWYERGRFGKINKDYWK